MSGFYHRLDEIAAKRTADLTLSDILTFVFLLALILGPAFAVFFYVVPFLYDLIGDWGAPYLIGIFGEWAKPVAFGMAVLALMMVIGWAMQIRENWVQSEIWTIPEGRGRLWRLIAHPLHRLTGGRYYTDKP